MVYSFRGVRRHFQDSKNSQTSCSVWPHPICPLLSFCRDINPPLPTSLQNAFGWLVLCEKLVFLFRFLVFIVFHLFVLLIIFDYYYYYCYFSFLFGC